MHVIHLHVMKVHARPEIAPSVRPLPLGYRKFVVYNVGILRLYNCRGGLQ